MSLAYHLMRAFPVSPAKDDPAWLSLDDALYERLSPHEQKQLREQACRFRYDYESENDSLAKYFGESRVRESLSGKAWLDLGSYIGARAVFWAEKYGPSEVHGIDVRPVYEQAAREFACAHGITATFKTGVGERLPYPNNRFDAITSLDVFEHVQDLGAVMRECWRVLRPNGRLLLCFPPYFQPLESHMGWATRLHGLQWLFSGDTLAKAGQRLVAERPDAERFSVVGKGFLEPWERAPSLNGATVKSFRRLLDPWKVLDWHTRPILTDGRRSERLPFRMLRTVFSPLAKLPLSEELFLGRICCVLEKSLN